MEKKNTRMPRAAARRSPLKIARESILVLSLDQMKIPIGGSDVNLTSSCAAQCCQSE
jgi:hypothetical protein